MKKYNRISSAFFIASLIIMFVLYINVCEGIENVSINQKEIILELINIILFRNEFFILSLCFYLSIGISVFIFIFSFVKRKNINLLSFLWTILFIYSLEILFECKNLKFKSYDLIYILFLFFFIMNYLCLIYLTFSNSFRVFVRKKELLNNVHLEKNDKEVDNIYTEEKNVENRTLSLEKNS